MTVVEVLVSTLILSIVIVAFLGFVDTFSQISRSQGDLAEETENLRYSMARLVRLVRMAGTGGVPPAYLDGGETLQPLALDMINSCDGSRIIGGRRPLAGTDVLVIRGVITSGLYDIRGAIAVDLGANRIVVPETSPYTGRTQELIDNDNEEGRPILIALQQALDIEPSHGGLRSCSSYRIVVAAGADPVTINDSVMAISFVASGVDAVGLNPGGSFTAFSEELAYAVGFLDELSFFIAENSTGEPALYRFRAGAPHAEELIPGITDLQVALGCDTDLDGIIADEEWRCAADGNAADGNAVACLREVRLSVVARSQNRSIRSSRSDSWRVDVPEDGAEISGSDLYFRYRKLTVRVALRCHSWPAS